MKFLILLSVLLAGCSSNPVKSKEVQVKTFECYAEDREDFKQRVEKGESLSGKKVFCNGEMIIVDTVVIHGPDQVLILNQTSGQWEPHNTNECGTLE